MSPFRVFRITARDQKERTLEEFVADKLMEKLRNEQDSPIVRSSNDKQPVMPNCDEQYREVESYLARISRVMTEMGVEEGPAMNKEFKIETLDSPTSSQQHQQVTISSSYLSQIMSNQDNNESVKSDLDSKLWGNEEDEKDGNVEELMRLVRDKLKGYETGTDIVTPCCSDGDDQDNEESIGNIIQALAKVKVAMNESQSVRSNSKNSRGFRFPSPRSRKSSTPKSATCENDEKKTVFGDDLALHGAGRKFKLRSPRPPKSPMTRNIPAKAENKVATPKASSPKPSPTVSTKTLTAKAWQQPTPPLSPAPDAHTPITFSVSIDPDNASVEGALLSSPSKQNQHSKVQDAQRLNAIKSPKSNASYIEVEPTQAKSVVTSTMASPRPKREIADILKWTDSTASSYAQDNEHKTTTLQLDTGNLERDDNGPGTPEMNILSPKLANDSIEIEAQDEAPLSPITRVQVEPDTVPTPTENKEAKREIDDILKWADESQVLEVNRALTPKHVPKEGPAWGFINGNNKKKRKNIRERANKAVQALRRKRGGSLISSVHSPRTLGPVASNNNTPMSTSGTTNVPERDSEQRCTLEAPESKSEQRDTLEDPERDLVQRDTLEELEKYIMEAEAEADCEDMDKLNPDTFARGTSKLLSTSERVDVLIPLLDTNDTRDTRETTSVACSRTTVPVTNKGTGNRTMESSSFRIKQLPIIEFEENQLQEEESHSFSTYATDDFMETEDEASILSGEGTDTNERLTPGMDQARSHLSDPLTRLEMSFSKDSTEKKRFSNIRNIHSISDLSSVFIEETQAVANELRLDMKNMSKGWLCF